MALHAQPVQKISVARDHAGQIAGFLASANTLGRIPTGGFALSLARLLQVAD